jgi:hypothetical protein
MLPVFTIATGASAGLSAQQYRTWFSLIDNEFLKVLMAVPDWL